MLKWSKPGSMGPTVGLLGFFLPSLKTMGQNLKLVLKEWKHDSPTQIRNENLGDHSLSILPSHRCLWEVHNGCWGCQGQRDR